MAQAEQYFAAEPQSKDVRKTLHVTLRGNEADVEVSNGVFSGNRVDLGTSVLLRQAPEPPEEGTFLDLGCGWGPIALTLGFESPKADIWALDVNERALELTRRNAELNGMGNIHAVTAEQVPAVLTFDLIWSNPPIRIGKDCIIRASFHEHEPGYAYNIIIDPKMAFGTRNHGLTRAVPPIWWCRGIWVPIR